MPITRCARLSVTTPMMLTVFGLGTIAMSPQTGHAQITFEPWHEFGLRGWSPTVAADLNGSGLTDIATFEEVANRDYRLVVAFNRGDGQFDVVNTGVMAGDLPTHLRAADMNGNGTVDLVWVSSHSFFTWFLNVFYNDGDGRSGRLKILDFSSRTAGDVVVGDFSRDGMPDVAVVEGWPRSSGPRVHIYHHDTGRLIRTQTIALPWTAGSSLVAGDLDGDGDIDLAVVTLDYFYDQGRYWVSGSELTVLHNDGVGSFDIAQRLSLPYRSRSTEFPSALAIGDWDGDGDLDLAVLAVSTRPEGRMELTAVENFRGSFILHMPQTFGTGSSVSAGWLDVADLDSNGTLDLIAVHPGQPIYVLRNVGNFTFESSPIISFVRPSAAPVMADLAGNGQFDLVLSDPLRRLLYRNVTPYSGPILDHTHLIRGQRATFTVTEAQPGETVHFLYSLSGAGNSVGIRQLGGITLDLLDPINIGPSARADANGVAVMEVDIPRNAPLRTVVIQAVIHRGPGGRDSVKTPFRTARIGE